jgi:deoxyribodipyrimidine photo-lyase
MPVKKKPTKTILDEKPEDNPNKGNRSEKKAHIKYALHIFRRDYRLVDNTALLEASRRATDGVILVFFFTYRQIKANPLKSNNCVQFLVESLEDLQGQIREASGGKAKLHIYYTPDEYECLDKLLAANPDIGAVSWNRDYTAYSMARDTKLEKVVTSKGREVIIRDDILLVPYGKVVTGGHSDGTGGKPYTKFTPFLHATLAHGVARPDGGRVRLAHTHMSGVQEFTGDLATFYGGTKNTQLPEKGGRSRCKQILAGIAEWRGYTANRDRLAYKTTHLSPFNKFGCVSIREVYWAIHEKLGASGTDLIRQLVWRDFFYNLSASHPYIYAKGAMNPKWHSVGQGDKIGWRTGAEANKLFRAWVKGRTGVPVVDACMREIAATGYMHNRGRLIAANYLCRILGIDWRRGEKYFASMLYDYDPAQNSFGWQVNAAVSGTESRPISQTILNPWIQSAKYDPDAEYIKRWLPEFAEIPARHIHRWDKYGPSYAADSGTDPSIRKKLGKYLLAPLIDYEAGKRANLKAYGY